MREAAILKQLNHKNIIKLQDVFLTDQRCYFLLEYMDEDLKRYLDKNRPLDRQIIKVENVRENPKDIIIFFIF
jgi:cyclin-dependent kinase 2